MYSKITTEVLEMKVKRIDICKLQNCSSQVLKSWDGGCRYAAIRKLISEAYPIDVKSVKILTNNLNSFINMFKGLG